MARTHTLRNLTNDKGQALANVWCRAYNASTSALVETQYTDSTGAVTFTALPDDANVNVLAVWGDNAKWFYNIYQATQDLLYLSVIDAVIGTCSITKLTAGNLTVTGTITTGELTSGATGVSITSAGINIWGVDNALVTRATKTGTIQCYVGSDGRLYAGAGAVWLDASGFSVNNTGATAFANFLFSGAPVGSIAATSATIFQIASVGDLQVLANPTNTLYFGRNSTTYGLAADTNLYPRTTNSVGLGTASYLWNNLYTKYLTVLSTGYVQVTGAATFYPTTDSYLGAADYPWYYTWTQYLNKVVQLSPYTNIMYDIQAFNTISWVGTSNNKFQYGYFTNLPSCPDGMPTSLKASDIIKKIKAPKLGKTDAYGERHYFKDTDFPDEMKVPVYKKIHRVKGKNAKGDEEIEVILEDTGEKENEYIRTVGILVQAMRELVERVETLERV